MVFRLEVNQFWKWKEKLTVLEISWKYFLARNLWKLNFLENNEAKMKVLHCTQCFWQKTTLSFYTCILEKKALEGLYFTRRGLILILWKGKKRYVTCKFSSWQLLFCFRQHMHILQPNQQVPHNIVSIWHEVFKTL